MHVCLFVKRAFAYDGDCQHMTKVKLLITILCVSVGIKSMAVLNRRTKLLFSWKRCCNWETIVLSTSGEISVLYYLIKKGLKSKHHVKVEKTIIIKLKLLKFTEIFKHKQKKLKLKETFQPNINHRHLESLPCATKD